MQELERLREENQLLRAALEIYAEKENWNAGSDFDGDEINVFGDWETPLIAFMPAQIALHPEQSLDDIEGQNRWDYKHTLKFNDHVLLETNDTKKYQNTLLWLDKVIRKMRNFVIDEASLRG